MNWTVEMDRKLRADFEFLAQAPDGAYGAFRYAYRELRKAGDAERECRQKIAFLEGRECSLTVGWWVANVDEPLELTWFLADAHADVIVSVVRDSTQPRLWSWEVLHSPDGSTLKDDVVLASGEDADIMVALRKAKDAYAREWPRKEVGK